MAIDPRQVIQETWTRRGLDPNAGLVIAQLESRLDPSAQNPNSSAGGLFQFIDGTAAQYGLSDKMNPYQNADAGARFYADNLTPVRNALGREPTIGEMYLAHQQGAGGAAKLLANPSARAVDVVGLDAVRLNGGDENMTAGEFANIWISRAEREAQNLGVSGGPERVYQAQSQEVPSQAASNVYKAYVSGEMSDPQMRAEYEAAVAAGAFPLPEGVTGLPQVESQPEQPAIPGIDPQQVQSVYDAYVSGNQMTPAIADEYEAAIESGAFPLPQGVAALPDIGGSLLPGGDDAPAPIARNEGSIAAQQSGRFFEGANTAMEGALGRGPSVAGPLMGETNSWFGRNVTNRAADLGLAALQSLGGVVAGGAGGVADGAEALGMSRNNAERLGRDLAAMPDAFAGSGSALGPAGGGLPTGFIKPRTGPLAEAARLSDDVTPNARVAAADGLVQDGATSGVRIMTSDVIQPNTFVAQWLQSMGEKIPVAGTGGPRSAQFAERVNAIENLVREYSPAGTTVDDLLPLLSKDLVAQRSATVAQYAGSKREVIERLGDAGPVDVTRTVNAIDQQIANLESLRLQGMQPVIRELQDWKTSIQGQNLPNIEQIRRNIGETFSGMDVAGSVRSAGQRALDSIYAPLREDMGAFIKTNGNRRDYTKWRVSNARLSESMGELESAALRRTLRTKDVNPETVRSLLFSQNRSDVQKFYNTLSPAGQSNARAAVLLEAMGQARTAEVSVSPTRFMSNLQRLGRQTGVVFTGQDQKALKGLERVLTATQRADQAAMNPPTGMQNMPFIGGVALTGIAGGPVRAIIGAGGLGGLARAYESPPMRNTLLAIQRARAGSEKERSLIARYESLARKALTTGAVTTGGQDDGATDQ